MEKRKEDGSGEEGGRKWKLEVRGGKRD